MQRRSFLALLGLGMPAAALAAPVSDDDFRHAQLARQLDRITRTTCASHGIIHVDGEVFDVHIVRRGWRK